jgi:hypothetical protein
VRLGNWSCSSLVWFNESAVGCLAGEPGLVTQAKALAEAGRVVVAVRGRGESYGATRLVAWWG